MESGRAFHSYRGVVRLDCASRLNWSLIYFWKIALVTDLEEIEESDRSAVELFMRLLDVDEPVAGALARAELTTIQEVASVPLAERLDIDAICLALLLAFRKRARRYVFVESMDISESIVWEN